MANSQLVYPLRFNNYDFIPMPVDDLARRLRVSHGFIHLCQTLGCPATSGEVSAAALLTWLFEKYPEVRALAGLKPLVEVEDFTPEVTARLRMSNALLTLLEYTRTRATDWKQKRQLRLAMEKADRLADSLP